MASENLFPTELYESGMSREPLEAKKDPKIGSETTYAVPIENFGKSVLGKLGWKEEAKIPLGKNMKPQDFNEPDFKNLVPRQNRLGLGAKPLSMDQIKKLNKNGENIRVINP